MKEECKDCDAIETISDLIKGRVALLAKLARYERALELATEEEAKALSMNCPLPDDECIHCHDHENSCHDVVILNHLDDARRNTQADNASDEGEG